ncbi:unnamed protein product [Cyprideis torosa]|uniref:Uncharacterized protein n=1 Tax=Cyprideis torosa TaxID=163714 RepID=A0A7R8W1P6_9CRUS|nr:unnamed protein product [Cyprideis torosa]CAG0880964.1 unnamed protein product [Cyprideis torosa]
MIRRELNIGSGNVAKILHEDLRGVAIPINPAHVTGNRDGFAHTQEEQLECMATWKEGSLQYLVGRLRIMGSKSRGDEDEFRCFVYDKREDKGTQASPRSKPKDANVLLSQSGDASCNGIYSASEGSRVMRMKKKAVPRTRCQFPDWATAHRWHSMGGTRSVYLFNKDGTSLRVLEKRLPVPGPPEKVSCLQEKFSFRDPSSTTFVVHALRECYGRYLCMVIHRRSEHLIEIQFGDPSREEEMACSDLYFNRTSTPFVTLITSNPPVVECPMLGQWIIGNDKTIVTSAGCTGTRSLLVGCGGSSNVGLEIREECTRQNYQQSQVVGNSAYICHASWEVNGTLFVVAAEESNPKHRTCFAIRTSRFTPTALASRYREREGARTMQKRGGDVVVDPFFWEEETTQLRLSASHGSCKRDIEPGSGGSISFNATMMGLCSERQVQWTSGVGERVSDSGAPLLLLISVVFGQYFTSQGSS